MARYTSKKCFVLFAFLLFLAQLLSSGSVNGFRDTSFFDEAELATDTFDDQITELMNNSHLPSLAVAIIKNESIVWSEGYGFADIKHQKRPTNETVYMIASISKTFATTAIMQLWEQGCFDLDDDINEYLPFSVRNPNYPNVPITFRMLLSHRSSISANNLRLFTYFSLFHYPYNHLEGYLTPGGLLYSPRIWKDVPPGKSTTYTSTGIELLGFLVECISNESFIKYCTNHIILPLDMNNTSYHVADYNKDHLATQYIYLFGKFIPLPYFEDRNYASGGLRSNLNDLSHYLSAFMNGGVYKGVRILKNETVDLMFTPQYSDSRFSGFGLGWQIFGSHDENNETNRRIGHNGGMPGSLTYMFYHVADDVGLIILSNQHLFYRIKEMVNWFSIIELLSNKAETV